METRKMETQQDNLNDRRRRWLTAAVRHLIPGSRGAVFAGDFSERYAMTNSNFRSAASFIGQGVRCAVGSALYKSEAFECRRIGYLIALTGLLVGLFDASTTNTPSVEQDHLDFAIGMLAACSTAYWRFSTARRSEWLSAVLALLLMLQLVLVLVSALPGRFEVAHLSVWATAISILAVGIAALYRYVSPPKQYEENQ
jgi:hypothetical protein